MNNLNSVLMEGQLTMNAILRNEEKTAKCIFSVKSTRKEEISIYNIEVYGKLAEVCGTLTKGRDVRIVGRLKQTSIGVVIIAEHIASQMGRIKTKKKSKSSAENLKKWRERKKDERN